MIASTFDVGPEQHPGGLLPETFGLQELQFLHEATQGGPNGIRAAADPTGTRAALFASGARSREASTNDNLLPKQVSTTTPRSAKPAGSSVSGSGVQTFVLEDLRQSPTLSRTEAAVTPKIGYVRLITLILESARDQ